MTLTIFIVAGLLLAGFIGYYIGRYTEDLKHDTKIMDANIEYKEMLEDIVLKVKKLVDKE